MAKQLIDLAIETLRCGNDANSNQAVQELLAAELAEIGAQTTSIAAGGTSHSLSLVGEKGPLLLYVGHSDVVSIGNEAEWAHPPFSGFSDDLFLFGRGAVDMRAANAAFVVALLKAWPLIKDSLRIGVAIAGDEETSAQGSPALLAWLQKQGIDVTACLVGEPSSESHTGDRIRVGRRGSLSASFTIEGESAHTAYVGGEHNVLHAALSVAKRLSELSWPQDPEPWPPVNFHITNFQSGTGETNVVPQSASFKLNVRFGPSLSRAQVIARCEEEAQAVLTACTGQNAALGMEFALQTAWTHGCLPYETQDKAFIEVVSSAVEAVTGVAPRRVVDGGSSDGRFFAAAGIPTVELGTPARGLHELNEALQLSDLYRLVELYESTLLTYARLGLSTGQRGE